MASQQELLDSVYQDFVKEIDNLNIKSWETPVEVTGKLIRALKRVTNSYGGTAMVIDGKKYTKNQLDNMEG